MRGPSARSWTTWKTTERRWTSNDGCPKWSDDLAIMSGPIQQQCYRSRLRARKSPRSLDLRDATDKCGQKPRITKSLVALAKTYRGSAGRVCMFRSRLGVVARGSNSRARPSVLYSII
mmetsp:Transcript_30163/g.99793  ORF Transcript_30163/g.99793 Transcript_30163/m.99793 type:complete len:118 (-) Transcript_30163:11-364(-)